MIQTTFLYYDVENGNGRIYTKKLAKQIVRQFNKMKKIGPVLGELDHPNRFEVNFENVSHEIEEIYIDEDKKAIVGIIKILETPKGKMLSSLLESVSGFSQVCCRSRGSGIVNDNTKEISDYTLYTFDIIPKQNDAFGNIEK